MKLTRVYKLRVYPNFQKKEEVRYTYAQFLRYVNLWCGKLFFNGNKSVSTEGLGQLANKAQHKARGIIQALVQASKATGEKTNIPVIRQLGCPAKVELNKQSCFDYWVSIESQFGRPVKVPALSHRKLNQALKSGWELNPVAEFVLDKEGRSFVRVFVQKEVAKAELETKTLGCDVGYRNSVSRSDKYVGRNTSKIIYKTRQKQSSRQRQGFKSSLTKTRVKQLLDVEAKLAVARCKRVGLSLVVESLRVLNNLRSGRLQGWARNYFANRCHVLGKEEGVFVWEVNPAYTSQTCSECGHVDKQSRSGLKFCCTACGFTANADVNAACNLAVKGTASLEKLAKRSGTVS
jgi:ribosomal protein L21